MWSYSGSRAFRRCQRQWFFQTKFGHHRAKDPLRKEAYLLSKLQSLDAWRGSLVDEVITKNIVPIVKRPRSFNLEAVLKEAERCFHEQLDFALKNRIRENDAKPSQALAAFHAIEYGEEITSNDIERAWKDVKTSLTNLLNMEALLAKLRQASHLVSQRSLTFKHFKGESVRAVPDLIAFYRQAPPLIVDWKVNTFGTQDHRGQLSVYAVALARCTIHSDFPDKLQQYEATDFQLMEAQLLTNQLREYRLSQSDVDYVDDYIVSTSTLMNLTNNKKGLLPSDFLSTIYPDNCSRCAFRRLCWEETL
jgi:CRISPR/Cas system-associated exonuclease Cas4 (RecB family)